MAIRPDVRNEIKQAFGQVPDWMEQMPDGAAEGFWAMARDFWLKETVLPNKTKELIGLAVAGATRCRYCSLFHTEAARVFGATDREIAESSMMGGLTNCGSTFLNAQQYDWEKFQRETRAIITHIKKNM